MHPIFKKSQNRKFRKDEFFLACDKKIFSIKQGKRPNGTQNPQQTIYQNDHKTWG